MSTDLSLFRDKSATIPAHLNKGLDDLTKSLMGGASLSKRISIMGGCWRMFVGSEEIAKVEERSIDVVIVNAAAKTSRSFHKEAYSEANKGKIPDCWSSDGAKPDPRAESPQSSACATCPMNIAGSGLGTSRACRFQRRLAVVLANDVESSDVFQLVLPAQSIFGKAENGKMPLEAYAKFIGGHSLSISSVVTELKFDTNSATPKLFLRAVRALTEEEMNVVAEKGQSPDALAAITFNPSSNDSASKVATTNVAPEETGPLFREEPKPKVKLEAVAVEEAAPVVREKKTPAAPAPETKNLEAVLSSWGDDE